LLLEATVYLTDRWGGGDQMPAWFLSHVSSQHGRANAEYWYSNHVLSHSDIVSKWLYIYHHTVAQSF